MLGPLVFEDARSGEAAALAVASGLEVLPAFGVEELELEPEDVAAAAELAVAVAAGF